jgi:hypothetical protein
MLKTLSQKKSFLAKAGIKLGNPPTYDGEHSLETFENWVAGILQYLSLYNLLGPQVDKVLLQLLGNALLVMPRNGSTEM